MHKLKELKELLEKLATKREELKSQKADFEKRIASFVSEITVLSESISRLKGELSVEALEEHKRTGEKKLKGGLGIREYTKLEYDEEEAKDWCKEKQLCLEVNMKAFEKLATTISISFVKVTKETTVTFPKEIVL